MRSLLTIWLLLGMSFQVISQEISLVPDTTHSRIQGDSADAIIDSNQLNDSLTGPDAPGNPAAGSGQSASTDPGALFSRASDLYQQEHYEEALDLYRHVIEAGFESPDLYYNMGNAAFRSNNIGYSILYYEKALKLDPYHHNARHNLEFVSRYRVDAFDEVPELFHRAWIQSLVNSLSENTWSLISIILFLLIAISIVIYLFSRRLSMKKTGFFAALVMVIFFTVSLSCAISRYRGIAQPAAAVITAPSVVVRSTPSQSGTELFILHEGTKVEVNENVAGWQNIRVIDGREGWITTGAFEPV